MLVGFIGCPGSFKTTLAVELFTNFKKLAIPTELVVEYARQYIAKVRWKNKLSYDEPVILTDADQVAIARKQYQVETFMKNSCGPGSVVISDSSPLNSRFYMSKECLESKEVKAITQAAISKYDLLFYCPMNESFEVDLKDSNRIHSLEIIKQVNKKAEVFVNELKKQGVPVETLIGDPEVRARDASSYISNKQCELIVRGL